MDHFIEIGYDRRAAVEYAHKWAFGRNPDFFDFEELGGTAQISRPSAYTRVRE